MGVVIILSGTVVAVAFAFLTSPEFSAGVLSGALTSTPGYSAALEVAGELEGLVTLGHAIAYPFGVIGVVLFVQLMPKFLKADMQYERSLLTADILESREIKTEKKLIKCDDFGLMPLALAIVCGLLLGAVKIPLTGEGYNGACRLVRRCIRMGKGRKRQVGRSYRSTIRHCQYFKHFSIFRHLIRYSSAWLFVRKNYY